MANEPKDLHPLEGEVIVPIPEDQRTIAKALKNAGRRFAQGQLASLVIVGELMDGNYVTYVTPTDNDVARAGVLMGVAMNTLGFVTQEDLATAEDDNEA